MKGLISSIAIVVSFMFLGGEIFKDNRLNPTAPLRTRIVGGIIAGIMGSILMIFSVSLSQDIIVDLRQFALIVIAMHGGFWSVLITGVIMTIFRVLYFSGTSSTTILSSILIISLSIICGFIAKSRMSENKKWIFMNSISIIMVGITLIIVLKDVNLLMNTLLYFSITSCITGFLVAYLSNHIVLSNALYQKFKLESTQDFLTGLSNIRTFDIKLNSSIEYSRTKQEKLSILMIDIDYFKKVNDTYGHLSGDEVLKELGDIISNSCRSIDVAFRTGGEEFCVILPDCPANRVIEVGERIRKAVEAHEFQLSNGRSIVITVSVGAATYPDTVQNINDIVEEADKALYKSKHSGRNKVSLNS